MYIGLKQPRGGGGRYVTPARAAAKETTGNEVPTANVENEFDFLNSVSLFWVCLTYFVAR